MAAALMVEPELRAGFDVRSPLCLTLYHALMVEPERRAGFDRRWSAGTTEEASRGDRRLSDGGG